MKNMIETPWFPLLAIEAALIQPLNKKKAKKKAKTKHKKT